MIALRGWPGFLFMPLSEAFERVRFERILHVVPVARVAQLVAEYRADVGRLPIQPWQDVPTALVLGQEISRILLCQVLQNRAALHDRGAVVDQHGDLLVGVLGR